MDNLQDTTVNAKSTQDSPVDITSPLWHEFVMSKFVENELDHGYPKVDGLRRVTELLMGDITDSYVEIVQCPSPDNERRATAVYHITIQSEQDTKRVLRNYSDAADSYGGNTKVYDRYPVAIATTRAEARTLRKALKLKTIAAEEREDFDNVPKVSDSQLNYVNLLCQRLNVNVLALLSGFSKKFKCKLYQEIPYDKVSEVMSYLNKVQTNTETPPEKIVGYDPNWRNLS